MSLRMSKIVVATGVLVTVLILLFPEQGLTAAIRGIHIWWDVLFPALLPFLVISEMMLGFGVVHFFGTLLDPMMRPLFRVPGIGGFVMAMGFASGYPVGARLTSQLWEQKLVTRDEGERLVAFTTTSDPIFLIGAVAVGFFHDAGLALVLALAHYGAAVIVGLLMRFHGGPQAARLMTRQGKESIFLRAFAAMHKARMEDGRTLSQLLYQAVESALRLMFVIGGLVVFFSVILELLTLANIMDFCYAAIYSLLSVAGIPEVLSQAVVNGLFEVTLGAKTAGSIGSDVQLVNKVAITAFILSWSGLSVHAQVMSLLTNTDIRYRPFLLARLVHGVIATMLVYVIWNPMEPMIARFSGIIPAVNAEGLYTIPAVMFSAAITLIMPILCIFPLYFLYRLWTLFIYDGFGGRR